MARTSDPTYISGSAPHLKIQPPILHPAWCVCRRCSALPEDERGEAHTFRIYRASKFPTSERDSIIHAFEVKRDEERSLVEARDAALKVAQDAEVSRPRLDAIAAAYIAHQEREGKRLDKNRPVVSSLVAHFGPTADPTGISKAEYVEWIAAQRESGRGAATIAKHSTILLAMLNSAVRDGLLASHQLHGVRRPSVRKKTKPVTFTRQQTAVLLGPAMERWAAEVGGRIAAYDPRTNMRAPTPVPLRGFCLIAYRTLMRPANNFGLEWRQLVLDDQTRTGCFRLDEHKNVSRGIEVEAALHPEVVTYLMETRCAANGSRFVHPNPETGLPYANITKHWQRLCAIANEILRAEGREELRGKRLEFYTWRHTGATRLAENGADPVMIVRMMGDTSLKTVMDHYFDSSLEHMQTMMQRWE